MKKLMLVLALLSAFVVAGFAGEVKKAPAYKSMEIVNVTPEKLTVKFSVNVKMAYDYLADRLQTQKAKLQKEIKSYGFLVFGDAKTKKDEAKKNLANKEKEIAVLAEYKGKTPKTVMVAGPFNAWKTLSSSVSNQMVGEGLGLYKSAPILIDRKSPKHKYVYKFVLYYGTRTEDSETTFVQYWIDDPTDSEDNRLDDGFGGYNSFFLYNKE